MLEIDAKYSLDMFRILPKISPGAYEIEKFLTPKTRHSSFCFGIFSIVFLKQSALFNALDTNTSIQNYKSMEICMIELVFF